MAAAEAVGMEQHHRRVLALVGDSDVALWPPQLRPQVDGGSRGGTFGVGFLSGQGGATLEQILPDIEEVVSKSAPGEELFLVVCAGENDIGSGLDMSTSVKAFESMLQLVFGTAGQTGKKEVELLFLGPKLEPWLSGDRESRNQYIRLSRRLQKLCREYQRAANIMFIDCLTMFCGESAELPGALFGGQALARGEFFQSDGLHLSNKGYQVWKRVIEESIRDIIDRRTEYRM